MKLSKSLHMRRKLRIRQKLKKINFGKPRLSVHRSNIHMYVQLIDDSTGRTIAFASTNEKIISEDIKKTSTVEAAKAVGKLVADRAVMSGITEVIFDRSGYIYHGRVKALAEAARENGLKF